MVGVPLLAAILASNCGKDDAKRTQALQGEKAGSMEKPPLESKIRLAYPLGELRWFEVQADSSTALIGPTTTRLFVVGKIPPEASRVWMEGVGGEFGTMAISGEAARNLGLVDSSEVVTKTVSGLLFDPTPFASIWYVGVQGVISEDRVVMEFLSQ